VFKLYFKNKLKNTYIYNKKLIIKLYKNLLSIVYISILKLILKVYFKHALRSRNYISFVGVFIRLFIPYFLFLLVK
jgi:hypothetical protein